MIGSCSESSMQKKQVSQYQLIKVSSASAWCLIWFTLVLINSCIKSIEVPFSPRLRNWIGLIFTVLRMLQTIGKYHINLSHPLISYQGLWDHRAQSTPWTGMGQLRHGTQSRGSHFTHPAWVQSRVWRGSTQGPPGTSVQDVQLSHLAQKSAVAVGIRYVSWWCCCCCWYQCWS